MYVRFEYTPYKEIYIPGVLSGLNPTSRYINKTYLMSTLSSGYNPETIITPVIKNYCESIKKCLFNSPYIYEYQSGFEEFRRKRKLEEADNIKYMKDPKFNNLDIIDCNIPDTLSSVISFYDEWESTNFELEDEIENFVL